MNVLIVINEKDARRRERLAEIVNTTIPGAQVTPTLKGTDDNDGRLLIEGDFELVMHHCGDSNTPGYNVFVTNCRKFCQQKGWACPAIVLFSGGGVAHAIDQYSGDEWVGVVTQQALEENLAAFLRAWDPSSTPPWDVLRGIGKEEASLQALSALLPIGLLWESVGDDRLEVIGALLGQGKGDEGMNRKTEVNKYLEGGVEPSLARKSLTEFERLVQDYACIRFLGIDASAAAHQRTENEGDLQTDLLASRWMSRLAKYCEKSPPDVLAGIDKVCSAKVVSEWNRELKDVRDAWLPTEAQGVGA